MFHKEILSAHQIELLPVIKNFRRNYYLVGGTAIALQLGHRRSIDFDLFTKKKVNKNKIKNDIRKFGFQINKVIYEEEGELHMSVHSVRMTFFNFSYDVNSSIDFDSIIYMPPLIDLASMKAFAFGQRAKWKDYVDMYFLFKNGFSLPEISARCEELFNTESSFVYSEKLFRQQLSYFGDIDYSDSVEYIGAEIPEQEIKDYLVKVATQPF